MIWYPVAKNDVTEDSDPKTSLAQTLLYGGAIVTSYQNHIAHVKWHILIATFFKKAKRIKVLPWTT